MTVIRRAIATDAPALADVAAITFPLACPPHTTEAAKADFIARNLGHDSFERYLADPERELFLAEDAGGVAGYVMVVHGEPSDADVAAAISARPTTELSKCYVHPDHHGHGVAGELIAAGIDAARRRGSSGVWLGVNQENARANRFYEKHGFARVGVKRFLVGDRYEDDFVRELLLTPAG